MRGSPGLAPDPTALMTGPLSSPPAHRLGLKTQSDMDIISELSLLQPKDLLKKT
jgi:hypothetical protein